MEEDNKLLKKASRRVNFKVHLTIFISVNLLLWLFWFFLLRGRPDATAQTLSQGLLFILLAWLVIVTAHYLFVYKWNKTLVEKELIKLKKEDEKRRKNIEKLKNEGEEGYEESNNEIK